MTAKIHRFPERPVREWSVLKGGLVEVLNDLGHPDELIEGVCETIRPIAMEVLMADNICISFTDADDALQKIDAAFYGVTNRLFLHLAVLAIDNHQLREQLMARGATC